MKITRYHTISGSTYDVKEIGGKTFVRRSRLGASHAKLGDEQLAKRAADPVAAGWTPVLDFVVGAKLAIKTSEGGRGTLYTSTIVRTEELQES